VALYIARQKITNAESELEDAKRAYLRKFGWNLTCSTPGSYWVWRRDFAQEDAAAHARWKERGPGPLGWPSEPQPYGVITAPTDLAVSMTERALDEEIEQDGDPETSAIKADDLSEHAA
jgi:hypothetical protein